MNPSDDKQQLLDDILGEGSGVWREASLNAALKAGRRRRIILHARNGMATVAVIAMLALLLRDGRSPSQLPTAPSVSTIAVIHSVPLDSRMLVRSSASGLTEISSVAGVVGRVTIVERALALPLIDDDELLRLAGRGSALVRQATGEVTLIRLEDPADTTNDSTPN